VIGRAAAVAKAHFVLRRAKLEHVKVRIGVVSNAHDAVERGPPGIGIRRVHPSAQRKGRFTVD